MGELRYRAFLSYAHKDKAAAERLHKALENFKIGKDLVGRATPRGPVPPSLRPIFRDRDDFSGGKSLTEATKESLDQSAALIVLCSPIAATREAVNEEVRLFRSRHPDRPVIPVILDGSFPDCYPPALRYVLDEGGHPTNQPITILGADLQSSGDGWTLGLAKIVSGLIGVPLDDIHQRVKRQRANALRLWSSVAVAFVALVAAGAYLYLETRTQGQVIAEKSRNEAMMIAFAENQCRANPNCDPNSIQQKGYVQTLIDLSKDADGGDADAQRVLDLVKAGRIKEAVDLKVALTDARAERERKRQAKDLREAASLAASGDPKRARELFARAAQIDPENTEGMFWAGQTALDAGDLATAETAFKNVLAQTESKPQDYFRLWSLNGLGDILVQRGDLPGARESYEAGLVIAERLAKSDPGNAGWQRDLSVSFTKVGDVRVAQGDWPGAQESYEAGLAILDRLAKSDLGNAGLHRDLSVSLEKVGDVQVAQGDLPSALKSYEAGLAISDRLAKSDPGNASWQRDLSVSYDRIGDVKRAQGDLPGALKSYEASLAIAERLAKSDPGNAGWQRDLAVSYGRIADIDAKLGRKAEALASFRKARDIVTRLIDISPTNATLPEDRAYYEARIAELEQ
jgi:tetratricopeptide (TPR) repeat protein